MTERIVASAVVHGRHAWWMPAPARHHDVHWMLRELFPEDDNDDVGYHGAQGFMTSEGRFVEREEAQLIAIAAGQIAVGKWGYLLYSEDLW